MLHTNVIEKSGFRVLGTDELIAVSGGNLHINGEGVDPLNPTFQGPDLGDGLNGDSQLPWVGSDWTVSQSPGEDSGTGTVTLSIPGPNFVLNLDYDLENDDLQNVELDLGEILAAYNLDEGELSGTVNFDVPGGQGSINITTNGNDASGTITFTFPL